MKTLVGSAKQIAWANEIRAKMSPVVEHLPTLAETLAARSERSNDAYVAQGLAEAAKAAIACAKFLGETEIAAEWIDLRVTPETVFKAGAWVAAPVDRQKRPAIALVREYARGSDMAQADYDRLSVSLNEL